MKNKLILILCFISLLSFSKTVVILDSGVNSNIKNLKKHSVIDSVNDSVGHGTHIFGIISNFLQNTNDSFISIKIGDNTSSIEDYLIGLQKAIDFNPDLINISFTHKNYNDIEEILIRNSKSIFIVAAGNEGIDLDKYPRYPCSYKLKNIKCVGSKNKNNLSFFSNYGKGIFYQNGEDVVSLTNNGLEIQSGTSQSAAFLTKKILENKIFNTK